MHLGSGLSNDRLVEVVVLLFFFKKVSLLMDLTDESGRPQISLFIQ